MAAFLVDTNVFAYAYDAGEEVKADRARICIRRLGDSRNGVVSAQILGEFFAVATRRLRPPLSAAEAEQIAMNLSRAWTVLDVTAAAALEAMRAAQQYQFQYFDGLIWATAKLNGIPNVLTEDLPSGSLIEGVRFEDPFDLRFDVARLD